jgi:alpha-galactosidase
VCLCPRFHLSDQLSIDSFTRTVNAHGSIVLKLSSTTATSPVSFTYYAAAASENIISNSATTRVVNGTATVVGFLGGPSDGTLRIQGVDGGASGGSKLTSIDYINGDWTQSDDTACPNCRVAFFSVNDGAPIGVEMPISGMVRASRSRLPIFGLTVNDTVMGHPCHRVLPRALWF